MSTEIDLYVICERALFDSDGAWLGALSVLAALDVRGLALQVRARTEDAARRAVLARVARAATTGSRVPVLLNGDGTRASRLAYDGAHWPEADIPRARHRGRGVRGASVHTPQASRRAARAGADFVVAGPVFDAGSKPVRGQGTDCLRAIAAAVELPVLAIGGITPARVAACLAVGAHGVAVVSHVLRARDPGTAVRALRSALDDARHVS